MERLIISGIAIGMVAISSCYYDVEEELYPPTSCQTENMSLQNNIVPILEELLCHILLPIRNASLLRILN